MNVPQTPALPDEYLTMPPKKVAAVLMKNSSEIFEIFGKKIGTYLSASLANEALQPTVSELLCQLIIPLQKCYRLEAELIQVEEDLADCVSDGIN